MEGTSQFSRFSMDFDGYVERAGFHLDNLGVEDRPPHQDCISAWNNQIPAKVLARNFARRHRRVDPGSDAATALAAITAAQRRWAESRKIDIDARLWTTSVDANLFRPLRPETELEFALGHGDELGSVDRPGKMSALHSSAALAVNIFDAWRGQPAAPLCRALRIDPSFTVAWLEAVHPTGLPGTPPHLDVELEAPGLPAVAIESKFTEPYRKVSNSFRPSYFGSDSIWTGLPRTRALAVELAEDASAFQSLHAAQLVKHAMGLTRSYGPDGFELMYLWYRADGPHSDGHQAELDRFADRIEDDFAFTAATYQDLLRSIAEGPSGWLPYMKDRYLEAGGTS